MVAAEPEADAIGSTPETIATATGPEAMPGEPAEPGVDEAGAQAASESAEGFGEPSDAPVGERVNLPIGADHPDPEEEPDAEEVRRQIAVASRSFDPDHQIRRAMDAFLSPPPGGERRPD